MRKDKLEYRSFRVPSKLLKTLKDIKNEDNTGKSINTIAIECLLIGLKEKYKIEL